MGQPARDPNDPRFIPARLGGTGAGFTKARDKQASPHYLGAISPEGSLTDRPASRIAHVDRTEDSKVVSKGLIRARARLVAIKSLDALADRVPSMDNGELVSAANVAGKLAGMTQPNKGQGVTVNIGQLHLAALQARKALSNSSGASPALCPGDTVDATILDEVAPSKDMGSNDIWDESIPDMG